jgi:hypothetical protein
LLHRVAEMVSTSGSSAYSSFALQVLGNTRE